MVEIKKVVGTIMLIAPPVSWIASYLVNNCSEVACRISWSWTITGIFIMLVGLILLISKKKEE